jgi:hypothetical protein
MNARYFALAGGAAALAESAAPGLISSVARRTTISPGFKFPDTSNKSPSATPFFTSTHSAWPL